MSNVGLCLLQSSLKLVVVSLVHFNMTSKLSLLLVTNLDLLVPSALHRRIAQISQLGDWECLIVNACIRGCVDHINSQRTIFIHDLHQESMLEHKNGLISLTIF